MDTRTGEIFPHDEMARLRALRSAELLQAEEGARLERFEQGLADGHVVDVSEAVARRQLLGQRVEQLVDEASGRGREDGPA